MKSNSFKATYSSWLQTHDKSHKEYQRRKRYPWHIIGNIEFSDELIGVTQEIYNKTEVLLGEAVIQDIKKRPEEDRIQFDFQIRTNTYTDDYSVVLFFANTFCINLPQYNGNSCLGIFPVVAS